MPSVAASTALLLCASPILFPLAFAAEPRPDWLAGSSAEYPKALYILGVGEGVTQEKAADKARAEVSKAFGLAVSARTRTSARETSDGSGSAVTQEVSEDVRTATARVIDGVEIARYWRSDEGLHYALAALNRGQALKILRDKLDQFDADSKRLAGELEKADGKFARLKAALELVRLSKARRLVNADFRVLNPEGKGLPAPEELADVLARARKAVAAVTVRVEAQGEDGPAVATRLIDALSSKGLKAVEGSKAPDLLIEAEAESRPLPAENLIWFWARGRIGVRMSYGASGEVFARFEESGEQAAREPGAAVDAVVMALADKAAARAFSTILTTELSDD